MKVFCIDIGNTHTHCATVDESFKAENSADFDSAGFAEVFDDMKLFEKAGRRQLVGALLFRVILRSFKTV